MSRKRRNTSSAEPDSPQTKRHHADSHSRAETSSASHEQPRIDTSTGLTGAFPGLPTDYEDGLFYGPAADGLDYLRMVRSEARNIPSLLTANEGEGINSHYNDQDNDYEGFFDDDEAFVAAPRLPIADSTDLSDAQKLYYEAILQQFHTLRERMQSAPPLYVIQAMPESIPISFPTSSRPARKTWGEYIQLNPPHPVQIACMDADSILELINFITKRMRKFLHSQDKDNVRYFGSWCLAMLAKCPDRGELGSEEISDLRTCAKTADMVRQWLSDRASGANSARHGLDVVSDEYDSDEVVERDVEYAVKTGEGETRLLHDDLHSDRLDDTVGTSQSAADLLQKQHIILDMIITVVGETYGQRDLLDLRRPWTAGKGG